MKLRRELGLRDVSLFAISCMVGTRWIASAAHAGPGSLILWFLAALLLIIPVAIATAALSVRHPEAGGLYVWTRADFGPWHGFLAFWIYWIGMAFWFPSAAMFYMSIATSLLGTHYAGLANDRVWLVSISLAAIWIALFTNMIGLKIGKWTENAGAVATWVLGALLVVAAALVWRKRGSATTFHLLPDWNPETLGLLATVAYAATGFEMLGFMAGEIREPARVLPRAAWITSIFTTVFYVSTTAALLVILPPGNISELNGLAQAGGEAATLLGGAWIGPAIAGLVVVNAVGQFGGIGSSVSRMPFAAGVDHLLPAAFAKIHPRWATPYISILAFGVLSSLLLVASQIGDTLRGAYQTLVSLMVIAGFLPYVYMFGSAWKTGRRVSALSGWSITGLAIIASLIPTAEVHNVWIFELKLAAGTLAVVVSARVVFLRASRLAGR